MTNFCWLIYQCSTITAYFFYLGVMLPGMQNKNIEHVTVHTTRENTTTSGYTNDIPDLQVNFSVNPLYVYGTSTMICNFIIIVGDSLNLNNTQ